MDPVTLAAIAAAIKIIGDIVANLSNGTVTPEQAQAYLRASSDHYNASRKAWDEAGGVA